MDGPILLPFFVVSFVMSIFYLLQDDYSLMYNYKSRSLELFASLKILAWLGSLITNVWDTDRAYFSTSGLEVVDRIAPYRTLGVVSYFSEIADAVPCSRRNVAKKPKTIRVGGFKHVLFSIIYGIILPIDFHIFQDG